MIEEFKLRLKTALKGELPGDDAHAIMLPLARDRNLVIPEQKFPPVRSAVMVLFYEDAHDHIKFPLIKRTTYNGAHSGQIALPGGKAEHSDRDLIHTALRETEEEIGIDRRNVEVVGQLTDLHIAVSNYLVTPVIGFTSARPAFTLDKQEVAAVIEADVYDLLDPSKRKKGTIVVREKYKIHTPYFEVNDRIVWGATAMMLSELSVVISKTNLLY